LDYPEKGDSKFLQYPHTNVHSTISKKLELFFSSAVGLSNL
jgi:hypothetical protein